MITPEIFNSNEVLRSKLAEAMDILNIAFDAADFAEEIDLNTGAQHDALAYSMKHAEHRAIIRYKERIFNLAKVPRESLGPLEVSYSGLTPFDQIAVDAEKEHAELIAKQRLSNSENTPNVSQPVKRKTNKK
jgi:hypothetical protein